MSLHESFIFADPVLERVFFDSRRFAPMQGREADVNQLQSRITERTVAFYRARSIDALERLTLGQYVRLKYKPKVTDDESDEEKKRSQYRRVRIAGIREMYFQVRGLCDGYYADSLMRLVDDGCVYIQAFAHDKSDPVFRPDHSARFHLWAKYARRRPVVQPGCRWF